MEQLKVLFNRIKDLGLPLIWVRDPIQKLPSVSLTLLMVSFVFMLAAILTNYLAFLKGIDGNLASNLFLTTAGLYFGRRLSIGKNTGGVEKQE